MVRVRRLTVVVFQDKLHVDVLEKPDHRMCLVSPDIGVAALGYKGSAIAWSWTQSGSHDLDSLANVECQTLQG